VMAVGDNWNDLEMLRWAGQPVLMQNASALLRAEAEKHGWQITGNNDEDGAALALERAMERTRRAELAEHESAAVAGKL
jgi:hydroxymethylpyrimidine pyrophosphatase-like HAD family hydrolase